MNRLIPLAVTVALGCNANPQDPSFAPLYGNWVTPDCPKEECGLNTTIMDGVYFSSLHTAGLLNDSGVGFLTFTNLPQYVVKIEVRRDRLVPIGPGGRPVPVSLNGVKMILTVGPKIYQVQITAVHNDLQYWAANEGVPFETYTFMYLQIAGPGTQSSAMPKALCKSEPAVGLARELDAVVFEGETYDAETKIINDAPGEDWFNIACLGGGPAKMYMMRHTKASSNPLKDVKTSPEERRALLNAWTGNYCGDGTSFTFTGQPLLMRDNKGWIDHESDWSWTDEEAMDALHSYEAIWNEDGAVCLDVPRLDDSDSSIGDAIKAHCLDVGHALPPCTAAPTSPDNVPSGWQTQGHILTANPAVAP